MTIVLSNLPAATRVALEQAAAVLRRSRATLVAATAFADGARQRLEAADARADVLQARMANVKHAGRRASWPAR